MHQNIQFIVEDLGFVFERHLALTEDGITLEMHRIFLDSAEKKPALLIQHGFWSCSESYILNGDDAVAFRFARLGYDVWLGNNRMSIYSRKHNPESKSRDYLDFSFWEVGKFDLPAEVDKALAITGHTKLSYMGYSEGSTSMFTALAEDFGSMSTKLNIYIAIAPVTRQSVEIDSVT